MTVDWTFIGALEGKSLLKAYVPDPEESQSGVTVGTGCDLGQMTKTSLKALGLNQALIDKLLPYVGAKKAAAQKLLKDKPLTLSRAEADALDGAVHNRALSSVKTAFDATTSKGAFDKLPAAARTVVTSVAFQYGNLQRRTPRFWKAATAEDWKAAEAELRNFGDRYATRRRKEADYLKNGLEPRKRPRKKPAPRA